MRIAGITSLIALVGCSSDDREDAEEFSNDYLNPTMMAGLYLGVDLPNQDLVDLSGTPFEQGATAQAMFAKLTDLDPVGAAIVQDAEVWVRNADDQRSDLTPDDSGMYMATSEESNALRYLADEEILFQARFDDRIREGVISAPPAVELELDPLHMTGNALEINVARPDIDSVLVGVFDVLNGTYVYSNHPDDLLSFYEFSHGGNDKSVRIPGAVLKEESLYLVGVAGIATATEDDFEGVNVALSCLMAGKLKFYPLVATADGKDSYGLLDLYEGLGGE